MSYKATFYRSKTIAATLGVLILYSAISQPIRESVQGRLLLLAFGKKKKEKKDKKLTSKFIFGPNSRLVIYKPEPI